MAVPMNLKKAVENRVREILKQYWNVELNIPVTFSSKMSRTQGYVQFRRYALTGKVSPLKMQFAECIFNGYWSEEYIEGIIKHECAHYALCVIGKPYGDRDFYFQAECAKIGAPLVGKGAQRELQMVPFSFGLNKKPEAKEAPKASKPSPKASKTTKPAEKAACELKPAERIKKAFAEMMPKLTKTQLTNLTNEAFCAKTFGLKYSFLKEFKSDSDRKVNGNNRYYAGTIIIFGKQYIMTNDLYKSTAEKFEAWCKA